MPARKGRQSAPRHGLHRSRQHPGPHPAHAGRTVTRTGRLNGWCGPTTALLSKDMPGNSGPLADRLSIWNENDACSRALRSNHQFDLKNEINKCSKTPIKSMYFYATYIYLFPELFLIYLHKDKWFIDKNFIDRFFIPMKPGSGK